ncbi:anti-sigma factor RsiW [Catenuloplanes nepalensis]|uniref:Anti-sigma factor RsiW n=1 Tax=Catenuloplanes nepalensis TaxID=587533 RepID=A0ABT9MXF7_9ACTN|nr:zf-HC2 domain-containing protein [Catenuloplanes nepalensis]MDP9796130.1 anti-sigma factor RsiW [Catenuloplanes nepalensis]
MGDDRDDAMAERANLALYLLGALPEGERADFERHLAGCDRCLAEALDLGPSTSGLGQFTDDDIHEFLTSVGNDDASIPEPEPPAPVVATAPVPRSRPARPEVPARPADNRPGRAPRRRRRWALLGVAAALILAVSGVSFAVLRDDGGAGDADLVATAEATSASVTFSVTVTDTPVEGLTARAAITGLEAGERYRLYAVTRDNSSVVIRDFTGEAGTQQVDGRLTVPIAEIAFFSVQVVDGRTIVVAHVPTGGPSPR